jgi:tetratricopeptide (TPR) repeat protein
MKFYSIILTACLAMCLSASALEDNFSKAQAAYDDGRYAEAVMLYDNMLSNGVANVELHYNLANACFKDGELTKAIWHYRKAWYSAPRDPDIKANLHFALSAAGAIDPAPGVVERFFTSLSTGEWAAVATASYLLLTLLLLLALLAGKIRRPMLKMSLVPIAALILSTGGWWQWRQFAKTPEYVVIKSGTTALFGPFEGATAHYKLPLAALVRQRATDPKGWVEVEYDGKTGWIRQNNILNLSP